MNTSCFVPSESTIAHAKLNTWNDASAASRTLSLAMSNGIGG